MDDLLGLEERICEPRAQVMQGVRCVHFGKFLGQITTFQVQDAIGQFVVVGRGNFAFNPIRKPAIRVTARLTTKSNSPETCSARAWMAFTFFSPAAFAAASTTLIFLPMLSHRTNSVSG